MLAGEPLYDRPAMRLNKFISETGRCSRREADDLISAGRVTRNGAVADVGTQVEDGDQIRIDGELITASDRPRAVYIALNKPVGIICTTERSVEGNIIDHVDHPERIFPIGRLDKESEGLILLTNDGDIVNEVLRVENDHDKEYVVAVDRPITDEALAELARGVRIDPGSHPTGTTVMTRRCEVGRVAAKVFRIVLTQGLNRQIRKMCEALGYEVVALQRTRIMHIELGHLKPGRWRNLTEAEVAALVPAPPSVRPERSSEQRDERSPRTGAAAPSSRGPAAAAPSSRSAPPTSVRPERSSEQRDERSRRTGPKPAPIPFGQPGGPGGPPLGRGGRGGGGRGRGR
jgi:23S rRNA pseudouridine2604 synthase